MNITTEMKVFCYIFLAPLSLLLLVFVKTFVHESGHALAAIFLNVEVTEFVVTFFDGGYVYTEIIPADNLHCYWAVKISIGISGGLAVCLFFAFLALFKKSFFVLSVIGFVDGFAEVLLNDVLRYDLANLNLLVLMIIIAIIFVRKIRSCTQ